MKKVSLLSIIALISCLYSCNFKNNHSNETNADSVVVEKLVIADTYISPEIPQSLLVKLS